MYTEEEVIDLIVNFDINKNKTVLISSSTEEYLKYMSEQKEKAKKYIYQQNVIKNFVDKGIKMCKLNK